MELRMEVYTPALELIGILEIYRSVIWEDHAFRAGTFSVESLITAHTRALLVPENILWIEGDTAGIIEHVEETAGGGGPSITVKGRLLSGILDRRILWGSYDLHGEPPALMYGLVEDCAIAPTRGDEAARRIPGLALDGAAPAGGESIRKQKTGGSLLETLEELGETNQVAYGVRFDPQTPQMLFWARPGVDRSIHQDAVDPVFYSTELDDVLASEYSYDAGEYKNVSLVAGEGEGADRVLITVEKTEPVETPDPEPDPGPASRLPDGYTELEYIETPVSSSTSRCGIDTGLNVDLSSTRIVMDVEARYPWTGPADTYLFSASTSNGGSCWFSFYTATQIHYKFASSENTQTLDHSDKRLVVDCDLASGTLSVMGTKYSISRASVVMGTNLFLFSCSGSFGTAKAKLYSCQIYDGDTLLRDLVPCSNASGEIGLYDLVEGRYHGNSLTGTLIAGPVVS